MQLSHHVGIAKPFVLRAKPNCAFYINISLVDLALSFSLFLYLSLYIFLFSLSVLLAKEERFICLHIYLAKMNEKL